MISCPSCGHRFSTRARRINTAGLRFAKAKPLKGRNMRISDRDEEEKIRRGYTHPRSFVRLDGSERLYAWDWANRKQELNARSDGACEMRDVMGLEHEERCTGDMHHPHHIIQRSVRRDDRLSNLAGLSWACHKEFKA